MCGIAGFAGVQDRRLLEAMTETLVHRGPDEAGYYHKRPVGLGSRRLAIIDLKTGSQPIAGEGAEAPVVVFNGEIYNFQALRKGLEEKHRFKTRTDTEVIVHLYEEKGLNALAELSGMFALALWDPKEERLLLARDPLGVKPLYYAVVGEKLYFGSELKALLKVPELSAEVDLASLDHYLDFLYIPSPHTMYGGIRKLRPGERLTWKGGKIETSLFWRPRARERAWTHREALEELDRLLEQVVREQKVSDVPLGLFLSGGLDSTALAAALARAGSMPQAFCAHYGKGNGDFNELEKARLVAKHFGCRLNELRVEPDVEGILDELVEAFSEPLADSSALPTYWVCREARRDVKVALTGIGGDEIFGGYPRYLGVRLRGPYLEAPAALRSLLAKGSRWIPDRLSSRNVGGWARRFLSTGCEPLPEAYARWMGHLSREDKSALYAPGLAGAAQGRDSAPLEALRESPEADPLRRVMSADLSTYLPEDLLALADRTSMARSLELRVPLCDQRLVEFALSLPSEFRVSGFTLKVLLKDWLASRVPPEILEQKKQGFMVPLGAWFQGSLRPLLEDSLGGLARRGLLREEGLRGFAAGHLEGRRGRTDVLWAMVLLERWFRRWKPDFKLDSAPAPAADRPAARRTLKILVVSDFLFLDDAGGSSRLAWETARGLRARGHDVLTWGLSKPGLHPAERRDGLEVRRFADGRLQLGPARWPGWLASARRSLNAVAAEFVPDRVITHHPLSAFIAQGAAGLRGLPFLHFYHSSWAEEYRLDAGGGPRAWAGSALRSALERRVLSRSSRVAVLSRYMRDDLLGRYGVPAGKLRLVPAGVDEERFRPGDKGQARKRLGWGDGPIVLTVRNFRRRIGIDLLIDAAEKLKAERPDLTLILAGSGPLEGELKGRVRAAGLQDWVRFPGRVPDEELPSYYQAADVFALPSRELEGLGLVLLEALATGLPCVGTPVGGIPEVLAPLEPAWISGAATPESLAAALGKVLRNGTPAGALREHVLSRYGWDKTSQGLEVLLYE